MSVKHTRRLVMIAPMVPEPVPEHAGGRLLTEMVERYAPEVELTVVVPHGPAVSRATPHPRINRLVVIPDAGLSSRRLGRQWSTYVTPGRPALWFRRGLAASEAAVSAVAAADVVDLQWQEQGELVPWVREVNPRAHVAVLLHDVLSQAAERSGAAASGSTVKAALVRRRWAWARRRARTVEARLTGATPHEGTPDSLVVLSHKDASLLPPGTVPVTVLSPPLGATYSHVERAESQGSEEILMVAYLARWANEDALRWFATTVLPRIRKKHPRVRLRVAGGGIRPSVADLARDHGIELLGFVPDLAPLYAAANVAVVPLREGAGLKFKVLDALSAGVPVVATPVGAEGVGPQGWFADIVAGPEEFARAVNRVLEDRPGAERRARAARQQVVDAYGDTGFRRALEQAYGPGIVARNEQVPEPSALVPEVSVVIPAYNAAGTIAGQLEALAHQVDAPPFEVVVADNRSTDGTADLARRWSSAFPCGLRVVGAHSRQGVSHARNRGCHEARAENILICDADDAVEPNWVHDMATALTHHAVVGSDAVPVRDGRSLERMPALQTIFGTVDYLLCGAFGIRRRVWAEVGGFDEAFPAGHEDVDFCRRVVAAGFELHPVPSTAIRYTQRAGSHRIARQAYHYAQGNLLLWTRLADTGISHPVSFTGSVRRAVALTLAAPLARADQAPERRSHEFGWAWGTVAGHLRYRVLGRPPAPRLWRSTP